MFIDLVNQRQSCRAYSDQPIVVSDLEKILEAARLSPSACNSQPWHYSVVLSEHHDVIASACAVKGLNAFANEAPCLIVVSENLNASQKVLDLSGRSFAEIDLGISVAHLCLCATELGLSTCIMGCFIEEAIKQELNLNAQYKVHLVIAVGYAANEAIRTKKRKDLSEISKRFE